MDDLAETSTATDLDDTEVMHDYTSNTTCNTAPVLPTTATWKGWFMDLNQYGKGEQTVTSALIAGGMVTFSTNRPTTTTAACSTSLGEARGYWVNLLNGSGAIGVSGNCGGSRSSIFVGGGLPPSPVLATAVPINGRATTVVIGAVQRGTTGTNVSISPQRLKPVISSKRKRTYSYSNQEN
jgi:Tfp pilus tip-associated adhesin PilY1